MPKCTAPQCRYTVAFVLFLYLNLNYMIRVDINITLLSMVNDTSDQSLERNVTTVCGTKSVVDRSQKHSTGTYLWSRPIQGLILGAFFWGYIIVQIPGGLLAHYFGPRWLGMVCILGSGVADMCLPSAAKLGWITTIVCRMVQGIFQGPMMPISACLIGRWVPPNERSRYTAFVYAGVQVGTVIGQSVSGTLSQVREVIDRETDLTEYVSYWPYVHYLFGALSLLLSLIWLFTVHDEPDVHPHITSAEREYLHLSLAHEADPSSTTKAKQPPPANEKADAILPINDKKISQTPVNEVDRLAVRSKKEPVPWRQILTSLPVWAIMICHVTYNWSWYSLITCMPTYMARVLGFDLFDNGLLSSIPYVVQCIIALVVAQTSDLLIARHVFSVTWVRKLNNLIALSGVGAGLLAVGSIGCRRVAAVCLLTTSIGLLGFSSSGYSANTVDLAPKFAGNIISVTNTLATFPGIFGPMLVGYITRDSSSVENWRIIFGVSTALAWFGALVNLVITSGEVQPWAQPSLLAEQEKPDQKVSTTDK
ncbi:Vesicular glutamate transporter 3 [Fasciola hepatica]|uniref:Vesicular glutamate transporter 3 n=1 Tax=Fasciola hepatica TaxID=6192 RepID=A0A4E0R6N8_FASHE|nr:Vesicular glutamate transporter 3 [Fasciola hepatica]